MDCDGVRAHRPGSKTYEHHIRGNHVAETRTRFLAHCSHSLVEPQEGLAAIPIRKYLEPRSARSFGRSRMKKVDRMADKKATDHAAHGHHGHHHHHAGHEH